MEGILKFNLPEDRLEFNIAVKGGDWYNVVWEMDQHLRSVMKYGELPEPIEDEYGRLRDKLREFMFDNNVNFDD